MTRAVIAGAAESPYSRHPPQGTTTVTLLADAYRRVLAAAGLDASAVDGLGVASFTLAPDHAIDLAWRLGIRPRWLMDDANGGAAGINLLQHAIRAVEAGDASTIVLLAGDHFPPGRFDDLIRTYNRTTAESDAPPTPNELFAEVTRAQMKLHGLVRADYGEIVLAQRRRAARNDGAVYREPMSLEQYLAAPIVAGPLGRFDCPPVVSGADALVVTSGRPGVGVRALRALHNFDSQNGDGLVTGLVHVRDALWAEAGAGPADVDVVSVYDDYPVMVLAQLEDLGFAPGGLRQAIAAVRGDRLAVNTSGGQLSAGQAGAAGGMHGIVEVVSQISERAGDHQIERVRLGLVTGYGMVLRRYGACANAVVLERA